MKVFSINPNTGKYFVDSKQHIIGGGFNITYQGIYNYTPIFPCYTFAVSNRFNYLNTNNTIEFYSMIPISRMFNNYLVEVRFRWILDARHKDSLVIAINEFNKFCENQIKTINVSNLVED